MNFAQFQLIRTSRGYQLKIAETSGILLYSFRSLDKLANTLIQKVQQAKKQNYTFIWIAPFVKELGHLLEHVSFWWLDPIAKTSNSSFGQVQLLTVRDFEDKMLHLKKNQKFVIEEYMPFANFMKRIVGESYAEKVREAIAKASARLKTIDHFEKCWKQNAKHNQHYWKTVKSITELPLRKPDALLLAGPSANNASLPNHFWSCDSALKFALSKGKIPSVVFSIDAGFASYEHFIGIDMNLLHKMDAVLDLLSFPKLFQLPFQNIYVYRSSHPIVQNTSFPLLENPTNDVYGIMQVVYQTLFQDRPMVLGHDMQHNQFVTHVRPSAYLENAVRKRDMFFSPELYFYQLSRRYSLRS